MEVVEFAALGSFSKESGSNVIQTWPPDKNIPKNEIIDIIDFLISNSNDQPSGFFSRFPLATLELPDKNWTIFGSSFVLSQTDLNTFYIYFLVINRQIINDNPHVQEGITESVGGVALLLHAILKSGKELDLAKPFINESFQTITHFCNSHIQSPLNPIPDISPQDVNFYSLVLTSHLETQMTTIIESPTEELCANLITFLSHFTFPYQLELSSTVLRDSPVQGLYIQCIKPQQSLPFNILAGFQRPFTYVNIKNKDVKQSPDWDYQRTTRLQLRQIHIQSIPLGNKERNVEAAKRQNAIMSKYKIKFMERNKKLDPCKWSNETLATILKANGPMRENVAAIKFSEIVYGSLSVIKFTESLMTEKQQTFLSSDHVQFMNKILNMDDDDLRMAVGVATAFDPKISSTVYTGCQAVIKKMLNAV